MRRSIAIPIAVVAVGLAIAFLVTPARDGVQALLGPPDEPVGLEPAPPPDASINLEPIAAGAGDEGFEVRRLTAEETARAEEILATDLRAKALLRGEGYTIEEVGPMGDSESGSNEPVGVSMLISVDPAISVEGFWLMKHDPGPGDPPGLGPQEVHVYFPDCAAPNGVRKVIALVYLGLDKLVQLEPLGVPGFDVNSDYCQGGPQ